MPQLAPATAIQKDYETTRRFTQQLCDRLAAEDFVVQAMPDCSPVKWHLAHTTWFFETFVLKKRAGYRPFDSTGTFEYLFNSYYNQVGPQFYRPDRGLLSRPTVAEVHEYRQYVDERLLPLLEDEETSGKLAAVVTLGIHHEQQHQELILTDLKYAFSLIPPRLRPSYRERRASAQERRDVPVAGARERRDASPADAQPMSWIYYPEGVRSIGHDGAGFAFDNETPRHRVLIHAFRLADRPVTNGEYLAFLEDGGYERPELWLSDGWACVQQQGWRSPLYWEQSEQRWWLMTLPGTRPVDPSRHAPGRPRRAGVPRELL